MAAMMTFCSSRLVQNVRCKKLIDKKKIETYETLLKKVSTRRRKLERKGIISLGN